MTVPRMGSAAALVFAGMVSVVGCSSKDTGGGDSSRAISPGPAATGSPAAPGADSAKTSSASTDPAHYSDANILAKEIAGDSSEVVIGNLAKTNAQSAAVKSYAAMLVRDHGTGEREARNLAKKLAITPQTAPGDTTAQATAHALDHLRALQGAAFDTAFVDHAVEDHKQDIQDAHAMSGAAQNRQVKSLVEKSLPVLQKHLDAAQKLAGRQQGKAR